MTITAAGLVNSKRKSRDGFTFFGTKCEDEEMNKQIDYELNITVNCNNSSMSNSQTKQSPLIFMIYFNKEECKYFIRAYTSLNKKKNETELPYIIVQIKNSYVSSNF